MRKADLLKNHQPFDQALARYRTFMEKVVAGGSIAGDAQERRDLAESVVLRLAANWESFVDGHLVDCVNRDPTRLSEFFGVTIPPNPSKDLCQALIFGDGYRDFHTFGDLKGLAKRLLPDTGNPFLAVSPSHAARIDEVYKIRNYLSHYSSKSQRALMRMYRTKHGMDRFYEPGQYLLAYNGTRLWPYFDAFAGASRDMALWYLI